MPGIRSLFRPFSNRMYRQVDESARLHLDGMSLAPRLDALSGQIEDVRQATVDVRRIMTDDLDASNEVAALLGRTLQELRSAIDELRADVTALQARLDPPAR
ncbi:MAG: hypothetical protein M3Q68_01335 [Actinomycetota bacterium]|nr:hypothetical protein [Actinomycetota bacterium]